MKGKKRYLVTFVIASILAAIGVKNPQAYAEIGAAVVDIVNGHSPG